MIQDAVKGYVESLLEMNWQVPEEQTKPFIEDKKYNINR